MDKDKKYVGVPRKLRVEQADKVDGRVAIIQTQRAAQSDDACFFLISAGTWPVIARV